MESSAIKLSKSASYGTIMDVDKDTQTHVAISSFERAVTLEDVPEHMPLEKWSDGAPPLLPSPEAAAVSPLKRPLSPVPRCLVALINTSSGSGQGDRLLSDFSKMIGPSFCVDMLKTRPEDALQVFKELALDDGISTPRLVLIVAGGDGTIQWVLTALDDLGLSSRVPIGVIPLGTGNDLSRCLGYGGGYDGESVEAFLRSFATAEVRQFDRWSITFSGASPPVAPKRRSRLFSSSSPAPFDPSSSSSSPPLHSIPSSSVPQASPHAENIAPLVSLPPASSSSAMSPSAPAGTSAAPSKTMLMNNYISFGVDAAIAHHFHLFRQKHPRMCKNRFINKLWYGSFGLKAMVTHPRIHRIFTMEMDGKPVEIPRHLTALVICNISSYAAGTDMWDFHEGDAPGKHNWQEQRFDDGIIEVMGVRSIPHLGLIKAGFKRAIKVAQGSRLVLRYIDPRNRDLPVQIDGEPFIQAPLGEIVIERFNQAQMLFAEEITPNCAAPALSAASRCLGSCLFRMCSCGSDDN